VTDNDAPGFTVVETGGSTAVTESGATDTLTVVLDVRPSTNVVLSVTTTDAGEATASPSNLTFTNANWDSPQTVTLTGVNDPIIDGAQTPSVVVSVIDASSDEAFDPLADESVAVVVTDDDVAGLAVAESGGSTSVSESGTSDTFTLVLNAQPSSNVVLSVTTGDPGEATASPTSLTFTPSNWNLARTVTVAGVNDVIADGTQTVIVTVSVVDAGSDDAFDAVTDQTVSVAVLDNDVNGFSMVQSGGATTVAESGTTDTFTVVLTAQPLSDVVLAVAASDAGEATATPTTLTFTTGNWNTPKTVTVTGVDDSILDGTQTSSVTLSVVDASSEDGYDAVADQAVTVSTTDNDVAGVTVSPTSGLFTTEAGGTATFGVALTAQPGSDVSVGISSGDTTEGTVSAASLTFTGSNWNVLQTVTVTGIDDALEDGTVAYTVATAAATSADTHFDGVNPADVAVANKDDDGAPVQVEVRALTPLVLDALDAGPMLRQGEFLFVREGLGADALQVTFTLRGTATRGVDYQPPSGSCVGNVCTVTFPPGSKAVPWTFLANPDLVNDVVESITVLLQPDFGYTPGLSPTDTILVP
jgi:hypothetical protein